MQNSWEGPSQVQDELEYDLQDSLSLFLSLILSPSLPPCFLYCLLSSYLLQFLPRRQPWSQSLNARRDPAFSINTLSLWVPSSVASSRVGPGREMGQCLRNGRGRQRRKVFGASAVWLHCLFIYPFALKPLTTQVHGQAWEPLSKGPWPLGILETSQMILIEVL